MGGVPGGVPGGVGGLIGGIIGAAPAMRASAAAEGGSAQAGPQRIRVGGNVQAGQPDQAACSRRIRRWPSRRVFRVWCEFTAIIGKDGTIQNLAVGQRSSAAGPGRDRKR